MRIAVLAVLICLLRASALEAGPVAGGPCNQGTLAEYSALGLTGCDVAIAGYNLTVTMQGYVTGTNNGTYPSDLSVIFLDPSFTALPGGGFEQRFQISLAPEGWTGVPGQTLAFYVLFGIALDRPVTTLTNTVTAQNGDITAEICAGGTYVFGKTCALGTEYLVTMSGTSASVSLGANAPLTTYGIEAGFGGILPDGQFHGITSVADVGAVPEPSGLSNAILGLGSLISARLRVSRLRATRP
jgi:hypothetical protein